MNMPSVIAPHARGKVVPDTIFAVAEKAKEAKEKYGKDQVIDGTIGVLLDDQLRLALLPSVEEASQRLKPEQVAPYAPIAGLPHFRQDVPAYLYGDLKERQPEECLATAGATGALRLCVWNFLEVGDTFITHDYFWSPYRTIASDSLRRLETFETYREDGCFNAQGALEKVEESLENQGRALLLINTPCHNPAGTSIQPEQMVELRDGLNDLALKYPDNPVTLLIDGAYWEFGDATQNRKLLETFQGLPENFLFCLAFTLSKSLTRYGLRVGALLMSNQSQNVVAQAAAVMKITIRTSWSNTNRLGQELFSTVFRDPALLAQLRGEQKGFKNLCNARGFTFAEEAGQAGLPILPYHGGFFAFLATNRSQEICAHLNEKNMFFVPMKNGIRVAICAIPSRVISGLADEIAACF